ncbi:alcohol dehydrogenase, partial [Burkholderia multivorans]
GRHVQIGLLDGEPVIDVPRVIALELSILGSHGIAAAGYPELAALVASGDLRPQDLVTTTIGLDQAPQAMLDMDDAGAATAGMTLIDLGLGR